MNDPTPLSIYQFRCSSNPNIRTTVRYTHVGYEQDTADGGRAQ